jgi:hypothetical protein
LVRFLFALKNRTATKSQQYMTSLFSHELQKIHRIARVITYSARTPKQLMLLALVGRFWREALVEYKLAAAVFDRIFDARNEWQNEDDVKQVWTQAVTILLRQDETAPLVSEMAAAMKRENARAVAEYDAAQTANAKRRFAQQRGTLTAAFRAVDRPSDTIAWFPEKKKRAVTVAPYVCLDEKLEDSFQISKTPAGFVSLLHYTNQPRVQKLDLSMLPSTLGHQSLFCLSLDSTVFASRIANFFSMVAAACPRIRGITLESCLGLLPDFSCGALPRTLTHGFFTNCEMVFVDGNLSELPSLQLTHLWLSGTNMKGELVGQVPPCLIQISVDDDQLKIVEPQRASLHIYL